MLDAAGRELASAELLVLAAGYASRALAGRAEKRLALQAVRGQVSWAWHEPGVADTLPPFPVNGCGGLIPALPLADASGRLAWITGSSFERDNTSTEIRPDDTQHNLGRLQTLLPAAAHQLADQFERGQVNAWAGVRCATPSHLPALGPLQGPDLWLCSGMGSRGLTFAALCGELLAARLHAEPLPLARRLADALLPQYAT